MHIIKIFIEYYLFAAPLIMLLLFGNNGYGLDILDDTEMEEICMGWSPKQIPVHKKTTEDKEKHTKGLGEEHEKDTGYGISSMEKTDDAYTVNMPKTNTREEGFTNQAEDNAFDPMLSFYGTPEDSGVPEKAPEGSFVETQQLYEGLDPISFLQKSLEDQISFMVNDELVFMGKDEVLDFLGGFLPGVDADELLKHLQMNNLILRVKGRFMVSPRLSGFRENVMYPRPMPNGMVCPKKELWMGR